jgi:hypothetical protein
MNIVIAFPQTEDTRINESIFLCRSSINRFSNLSLLEVSGTPRPFLGEMLTLCYDKAKQNNQAWFGWINGDCQLLYNPEQLIANNQFDVYGLKRLEMYIGEKCQGVDGYIISCHFWENVLSKDIPKMYVGGTHVDWWLTRATQKYGIYKESYLLSHLPHDRTLTSLGVDTFGVNNLTEYNDWAVRNSINP